MPKRHSSSVAIPRLETGTRVLRLRADERLATRFESASVGDAGRLIVSSREPLIRGEAITVEISFGPLADEVELSGEVDAIEARDDAAPRVTIRIRRDHRSRVEYVQKVLAGARDASARNHRRIPTDLAASWRAGGHRITSRVASRIRDLSRGGAFIVSRHVPQVGDNVWVEIGPNNGTSALEVEGTVSWVRNGGREAGFGVSFKLRDRSIAAALHQVVRDQERAAELR